MAPAFAHEGIYTGYLFTSVSTNAVTIEPVFYWPHGYRPIHAVAAEKSHMARIPQLAENAAATAVVAEARRRVVEVFETFGAGHFQIGRAYPYRASRDTASRALLDAIKAVADPAGRINPGGLGFPVEPSVG